MSGAPRIDARSESGTMLVELVIALFFLATAVGALLSVYAATHLSLRRAGTAGTALTLAERQIEAFKRRPYSTIMLTASTIPGSGDPYVTANGQDPTIPPASGQVTGGTTTACTTTTQAEAECAVQTTTGPDGRLYRIDTYVHTVSPAGGGRTIKAVTVVTRTISDATVGPVKARATSLFDQAHPPS